MISLTKKRPDVIQAELAQRVRAKRKKLGLTQSALAEASGVSLGSIKRFESLHQISLTSLVKISIALDCREDFDLLFSQTHYNSIEEVIADAKQSRQGA